jgi:hypothetical protein
VRRALTAVIVLLVAPFAHGAVASYLLIRPQSLL